MFIAKDDNTKEVLQLISSSRKIDCAVAFLGGKAPEFLGNKGGRIICNLDSNGTNPSAVEKLFKRKNFEIRNLSDLHAKVYIGDSFGIVSSANLSANGLGLEDDELNGWQEAGYKVTDKDQIKRMRGWFENLWEDALTIRQPDINSAKLKWLEHRKNRMFPSRQEKKSFLEELKSNQANFQDRNIYLTITTDYMSDPAQKELKSIKKQEPQLSKILDAYEDWGNLPRGAYLIDLYLKEGKVKPAFLGLSRSPAITDPVGKIKSPNKLFLCYKETEIFGFKISKEDKKELKDKVEKLWSANIGEGDEDAKFIKIEDAFEILLG